MVDKFRRVRPVTLGEASRIPGATPAAVLVLDIHLSYSGGVFHVERGVRGTAAGGAALSVRIGLGW